jgi:hypothetical protein
MLHHRLIGGSGGGGGGGDISGRLRVAGRFLQNDKGDYRPVWNDALSILSHSQDDMKSYLDWNVYRGFGGIRVFAGDLGWANPPQTPQIALDALPTLMALSQDRGLYVEVTALTGTSTGYNVEHHVREVNRIVSSYINPVVEIANEPYHGTQSEKVHDPAYLLQVSNLIDPDIIVALGASIDDESDAFAGGDYVTVHLDRGRDDWNMVRRVRELENLSASTRKFVMNNEPKKAGSQLADPAIVFTMAVLNRGFEVGGIFHSDAGLMAVVPDAAQDHFAAEYIAGSRVITTNQRMNFQNAGWATSPIKSAYFDDGVQGGTGLVRAYSFMSEEQNVLVEVGAGSNTQVVTQHGWKLGPVIAERLAHDGRKCRVTELVR